MRFMHNAGGLQGRDADTKRASQQNGSPLFSTPTRAPTSRNAPRLPAQTRGPMARAKRKRRWRSQRRKSGMQCRRWSRLWSSFCLRSSKCVVHVMSQSCCAAAVSWARRFATASSTCSVLILALACAAGAALPACTNKSLGGAGHLPGHVSRSRRCAAAGLVPYRGRLDGKYIAIHACRRRAPIRCNVKR